MIFRTLLSSLLALQLASLSNLAKAQSSDFDRAFSQSGAEARLSFTIPLGESRDKSKMEPRLGFAVRNYSQPSQNSCDWMLAERPNYTEARFDFTLNETPQFMLNDQVLVLSEDEQANIGTAGKIALGVTAAALVGVAVIAVAFASCDPNCFEEE